MLSNNSESNPYLEQEILTASPIRLRWMLISRAEELCGFVKQLWADGEALQAAGWLLRIREILGELLDGVKDRENPLSTQVADFYVFLLQLLTRVEQSQDVSQLQTLQELLHLENETWKMLLQKVSSEAVGIATTPAAPFPATLASNDLTGDYSGGLSIEA